MPDGTQQFQYIKLPDGSYGKFAANATDDQIRAAISKDFPNAFGHPSESQQVAAGLPAGSPLPIPSGMTASNAPIDPYTGSRIDNPAYQNPDYQTARKRLELANLISVAKTGKEIPLAGARTFALGALGDAAPTPKAAALGAGTVIAPEVTVPYMAGEGIYNTVGGARQIYQEGATPENVQRTLGGAAETVGSGAAGIADIPGSVRASQPLPDEMAARGITKAVNPAVNEWPTYIRSVAKEAGNIQDFARRNNLPMDTQLDWAAAARGAAEETKAFYDNQILGPHSDDVVNVRETGMHGNGGQLRATASLQEINDRIGDINDELRANYAKRETGQVMTALNNDVDLVAERSALADRLHDELSARTGLPPEDIASIRQRVGRLFDIADRTEAAVNQRQSSAGKINEGRVPLTAAGVAQDVINRARGGTEGIADKSFRSALARARDIRASQLPKINSQTVAIGPTRKPVWGGNQ